MYLIKSIIDFILVLLLLRLLIRSNEAYFDPIYRLIYRITDPILTPSRYVARSSTTGALLTIAAVVVLRGAIYMPVGPMTFINGIGVSLMSLIQLLFQGYMVMWFISLLSERSFGTPLLSMMARAFYPLTAVLAWLKIPRRQFHVAVFLLLLVLYAFSSIVIRNVLLPKATMSAVSVFFGLGEGLFLILGLFPGFFSLVIIIGALLSWVSPDPYNPIVQAIYGISEPLLRPFRRFVPNLGGIDFSPFLAIICFQILGRFGQQLIVGFLKTF